MFADPLLKNELLASSGSSGSDRIESGSSHGNMYTIEQERNLKQNPHPWSSSIGGPKAAGDGIQLLIFFNVIFNI
ncbi:hypothetical protein B9Z55_015583 [Caenorhabditis nigoni]|nr:hypothetical protein B9Z55_015583 [Caenorhabditis nigoni]